MNSESVTVGLDGSQGIVAQDDMNGLRVPIDSAREPEAFVCADWDIVFRVIQIQMQPEYAGLAHKAYYKGVALICLLVGVGGVVAQIRIGRDHKRAVCRV